MLKIGDFSLTGRVSVRTLRHYDDLGLLRPARVDPATGYRFYAIGQLPRLHRILALKELGLSLEEIAAVLEDGPSPADLRAMLERKRAEVRRLVESEQARLARISAHLDQIEREEIMEGYDVLLKPVPAQRVATLRETLPAYPAIGRLFDELRAYVYGNGLQAGAWTSLWHCPEFQERDVDGEAAVVIDDPLPLPPHPRIVPAELPAVPAMACAIHHGPYASLNRAYAALGAWLAANGYRTVGPTREVYHHGGPDQHDPSYVTELQFPVAKP